MLDRVVKRIDKTKEEETKRKQKKNEATDGRERQVDVYSQVDSDQCTPGKEVIGAEWVWLLRNGCVSSTASWPSPIAVLLDWCRMGGEGVSVG